MNKEILKAKVAEAISSTNTSGNQKLDAIMGSIDTFLSSSHPSDTPHTAINENWKDELFKLIETWESQKHPDKYSKIESFVQALIAPHTADAEGQEWDIQNARLIESIENMKINGIAGCTYGDTEFDSLSAAYGFNEAIDNVILWIVKSFSA